MFFLGFALRWEGEAVVHRMPGASKGHKAKADDSDFLCTAMYFLYTAVHIFKCYLLA